MIGNFTLRPHETNQNIRWKVKGENIFSILFITCSFYRTCARARSANRRRCRTKRWAGTTRDPSQDTFPPGQNLCSTLTSKLCKVTRSVTIPTGPRRRPPRPQGPPRPRFSSPRAIHFLADLTEGNKIGILFPGNLHIVSVARET